MKLLARSFVRRLADPNDQRMNLGEHCYIGLEALSGLVFGSPHSLSCAGSGRWAASGFSLIGKLVRLEVQRTPT